MADYRDNVISSILTFAKNEGNSALESHDILTVIDSHQLLGVQKESSIQETVGHIHSCLNTAANRQDGLLLLKKLVCQCSTDVFTSYVQTWFNLLIQFLQTPDNFLEKQLTCKILSDIINVSSQFPEQSREVSSSIIPKLIPQLLTATSSWQKEATQCLCDCITYCTGPCRSFKSKIEAYVIRDLNRLSPQKSSIQCFAKLARIADNQPGKRIDTWTDQCRRVLASLHNALGLLYEGLEIEQAPEHDCTIFSPLPETEPERSSALTSRYKILVACLDAMLSEEYSSSVKIPGPGILKLICRCLAVNYKMLLGRPSSTRLRLFSHLPELHKASLSLLAALIKSCRTQLLPLSDVINKLFVQCLVYTHLDGLYGHDRPLSMLRLETYSCMVQWLQILGPSSNILTEEKDLVKELLHDVVPVTDTLKLSGSSKPSLESPPAKKKRKGSYQELTEGISSHRKINKTANSAVTLHALQVTQHFMSNFGQIVKNKQYQDILDGITSTILVVQQDLSDASIPYQSADCREALYRTLLACCLQTHFKVASPLHVGLRLFRTGLQDPSIQVSCACLEALRICECLVHPRAPSIQGARLVQTVISVQTVGKDVNQNKIQFPVHNSSNINHTTNISSTETRESSQKGNPLQSNGVQNISNSEDRSPRQVNSSDPDISRPSTDGGSLEASKTASISGDEDVGREEESSSDEDSEMDAEDQLVQELSSEEKPEAEVNTSTEDPGVGSQQSVVGDRDCRTGAGDPGVLTKVQGISDQAIRDTEVPSTSNQKEVQADETVQSVDKSSDLDAMLMSFVDAGPDSD